MGNEFTTSGRTEYFSQNISRNLKTQIEIEVPCKGFPKPNHNVTRTFTYIKVHFTRRSSFWENNHGRIQSWIPSATSLPFPGYFFVGAKTWMYWSYCRSESSIIDSTKEEQIPNPISTQLKATQLRNWHLFAEDNSSFTSSVPGNLRQFLWWTAFDLLM